mmetsp:Transcript_13339/g.31245  ORF Transcript_13339/g.31245 Transcript_13339/m.31245 type:complete len:184 (-) Transcript_13339:70-621(-)
MSLFGAAYTLVGYGMGSVSTPEVVVFLDVDGVLHSAKGDQDLFQPHCCSYLRRIVEETGASIVLSSAWRLYYGTLFKVNEVLMRLRLPPAVGVTADFGGRPREEEICQWLDEHPGVKSWIAIDDMPLDRGQSQPFLRWYVPSSPASARMVGHFVKTVPEVGLTEGDVSLAISLLKQQDWLGGA